MQFCICVVVFLHTFLTNLSARVLRVKKQQSFPILPLIHKKTAHSLCCTPQLFPEEISFLLKYFSFSEKKFFPRCQHFCRCAPNTEKKFFQAFSFVLFRHIFKSCDKKDNIAGLRGAAQHALPRRADRARLKML